MVCFWGWVGKGVFGGQCTWWVSMHVPQLPSTYELMNKPKWVLMVCFPGGVVFGGEAEGGERAEEGEVFLGGLGGGGV